jgi:hypothetical protein
MAYVYVILEKSEPDEHGECDDLPYASLTPEGIVKVAEGLDMPEHLILEIKAAIAEFDKADKDEGYAGVTDYLDEDFTFLIAELE